MSHFAVTILGSNSALPAYGRHPSSQYINIHASTLLMDCGEGTQFRMKSFKCSPMKLDYIFISHLHGDHVFGLPGLLTSFILLRRTEPLTLIGPAGIKGFIETIFKYTYTTLPFELIIIETNPEVSQLVFENNDFQAISIPLDHSIPCNGYLFKEKPGPYNIDKSIITEYQLTYVDIIQIKEGKRVETIKGWLEPSHALFQKRKSISNAYCSDTTLKPDLVNLLSGTEVIYHETTYENALLEKARSRKHSVSQDAAFIAKNCGAEMLIIGHLSSKYPTHIDILNECKEIFPETYYAYEGSTFIL